MRFIGVCPLLLMRVCVCVLVWVSTVSSCDLAMANAIVATPNSTFTYLPCSSSSYPSSYMAVVMVEALVARVAGAEEASDNS